MSPFHNSTAGEKFAMHAHEVWAFASLSQAMFSIAAAWVLFPLAMLAVGMFGHYVFGVLMFLYAQIVLGFGGVIFHLAGARDHRKNLEEICRQDKRGE